MSDLQLLEHRVRPAEGDHPIGALILLHGRGAHELDLFPLLDVFDPDRRLVGVTPRAPLELSPGGFHWYLSAGIPTPDPRTFRESVELLGLWMAAFVEANELDFSRTVIGGFSQGTVMSYSLALGEGRPRPAGLLAFSGFMPEVPGFNLDLGLARDLPVVMGHGTADTVIPVLWSRQARERLERSGARVLYRESLMPHSIDPSFAAEVPDWIQGIFSALPY